MFTTDREIAEFIVARLNALIVDPAIRADVRRLLSLRIECSHATANHPTIQVGWDVGAGSPPEFGILGLLNGIVGTISGGKFDGWGYIAACLDETSGELVRFAITDCRSEEHTSELQ